MVSVSRSGWATQARRAAGRAAAGPARPASRGQAVAAERRQPRSRGRRRPRPARAALRAVRDSSGCHAQPSLGRRRAAVRRRSRRWSSTPARKPGSAGGLAQMSSGAESGSASRNARESRSDRGRQAEARNRQASDRACRPSAVSFAHRCDFRAATLLSLPQASAEFAIRQRCRLLYSQAGNQTRSGLRDRAPVSGRRGTG